MLRTRAPLSPAPKGRFSFDLHVLGPPQTFALSQDQTLQFELGMLELRCCSILGWSCVRWLAPRVHRRDAGRCRPASPTRDRSPSFDVDPRRSRARWTCGPSLVQLSSFQGACRGGCSGTEFRLNRAPSLGVVIYAGLLLESRGLRRFFWGTFAQPGGVAVGAIDALPNREGPWQPTPPCFGPSLVPGRDGGPKAKHPNPGAGYGTPPSDSRKSFFRGRNAAERRSGSHPNLS